MIKDLVCITAVIASILLGTIHVEAQRFIVRGNFGTLNYQGDLAPNPIRLSFGPTNYTWSVNAGLDINDWVNVLLNYRLGRLSGDDVYASDMVLKQRNLSFVSPLYEYGISSELNMSKFWHGLDKYNLKLYLTSGVNFIRFDPHANYLGKWYKLNPLGTEGQTLLGSTTKPYRLSSFSIPIGTFICFPITSRWKLGIEFKGNMTFTDYLDDVSTTFPNVDLMIEQGNILGAKLSNRSDEINHGNSQLFKPGMLRGNPNNKDWYTYFGFFVEYRLGKRKSDPIYHLPDDSLPFEEIYDDKP